MDISVPVFARIAKARLALMHFLSENRLYLKFSRRRWNGQDGCLVIVKATMAIMTIM